MKLFNKLSDWWHTSPPVVVFVLTIGACALTLATLSLYIDVHKNKIPNPNVQDWNSFFESLSKLKLCIPASALQSATGGGNNAPRIQGHWEQGNVTSRVGLVAVSLQRTADESDGTLQDILEKHSLEVVLTEDMLGSRVARGQTAATMALSLSLPDTPVAASNQQDAPSGAVQACVTFTGPPRLMPDSLIAPTPCTPRQLRSVRVAVSTLCAGNETLHQLVLLPQQHLTPLLSQEETVLIQLHLLYTTCALVLLVLLLLCYAVCRRLGGTHSMPSRGAVPGAAVLLDNESLQSR